jgi:hypothetical protein
MNIFIFAHGCRSIKTFKSDSIQMHFKSNDGEVCRADATVIDLDKTHYNHHVSQNGPFRLPNDYELSFFDVMEGFGLNTFGVFNETGECFNGLINLDKSKEKQYYLSDIIAMCKHHFTINNIYLGVCRAPCSGPSGGKNKKRKTNRRKRKNKKRKTNRRNYKR